MPRRRSTTYNMQRRRAGIARRGGRGSATDGRSNNNGNFASVDMRQKQADAARGGRNERGQFSNTRVPTYTRSQNGRLAVVDERGNVSTANARTWTMTPKNDDGSPVTGRNGKPRQSGRSQIANRSQRYYDVRAGFNNISPRAAAAMLEAGQITQSEYDRMFGGGGNAGGGGGGSLGLGNG